jgi:hypothetical protein
VAFPVLVSLETSTGEVVIEGFTITGEGPGIDAPGTFGPDLTIRRCRLLACHRAVYITTTNLRMEDCEVAYNEDRGYLQVSAVGVEADFANAEILRTSFHDNEDWWVMLFYTGDPVDNTLVVRDCEFVENRGAGCVAVITYDHVTIENNLFARNRGAASAVGLYLGHCSGTAQFNTFAYDSVEAGGGVGGLQVSSGDWYPSSMTVTNNTFYGCHSDDPSQIAAVFTGIQTPTTFQGNIVAASTGAPATYSTLDDALVGCNVYWANEVFDAKHWPLAPTDQFVDPQFCDPAQLDFQIRSTSPCGPANSPICGLIGAWDVGCGPVSVGPRSWSKVKAGYR